MSELFETLKAISVRQGLKIRHPNFETQFEFIVDDELTLSVFGELHYEIDKYYGSDIDGNRGEDALLIGPIDFVCTDKNHDPITKDTLDPKVVEDIQRKILDAFEREYYGH